MRFGPVLLSLGVLALAGCQTTGGIHQPTSPGSQPASPSTTGEATTPPKPSPWALARERGMAFRAVGNEPGWSVEVEKSHSPTLFVSLQYNQRHLKVRDSSVSSDQDKGLITFSGLAKDGTPVQLLIHRGQCVDNMSGHKFAASAELDVGAKKYTGCGRFLMQ
ncbi:MAG TPA: hypothetical protein VFJ15_07225 [Oleiagrimonas sp.]|nr:hypothetical protein [Oleiagrimonas sp.]